MKRSRQAGLTLLEVLIAVSLLSLLSLGMLMAMRIGFNAMTKSNAKLMDNRRVANTQKVLEQQIAGLMPVNAVVGRGKLPFFEGEPESMRFVSSYSLQDGSRGIPQILEFQVSPREHNEGVRLTVNEIPYTGPLSAGALSLGLIFDPVAGVATQRFRPIEIGPRSFVLADRLAYCRFAYLESRPKPVLQIWRDRWILPQWPLAVQIAMAPLAADPARLQITGVTAPVHVNRPPVLTDGDYY